MRRLKNEVFNKYFGTKQNMVDESKNRWRASHNREYLTTALNNLTSLTYKEFFNEPDAHITTLMKNEKNLKDYLDVYEFYCQVVSMKIKGGQANEK